MSEEREIEKTGKRLPGFLARLRHPWLFAVATVLFGVDVVVPDVVPFAEEAVLGAFAILFGTLKQKRRDQRDASTEADLQDDEAAEDDPSTADGSA